MQYRKFKNKSLIKLINIKCIEKDDVECLFQKIIGKFIQEKLNVYLKEILTYDKVETNHIFQILRHNCEILCPNSCDHQCFKSLGKLMRKNLVFYCYGEAEIIKKEEIGALADLEKFSCYAYKNRLPYRQPKQDGLPGEVLFDLLIQMLFPNAYKMAVRTIFRQNDNNEIKGYDLTYFTIDAGKVTLWLGQAKLGQESYCKKGIDEDLASKFESQYLSKQIYFLADKQCGLTEEGIKLTDLINKLNLINSEKNDEQRAHAFIQFIKDENITINIPCLLAYGKQSVYSNVEEIEEAITNEMESMKKYFQDRTYKFEEFYPQLMFFVFPLEDLEKLRGVDGFYAGLR